MVLSRVRRCLCVPGTAAAVPLSRSLSSSSREESSRTRTITVRDSVLTLRVSFVRPSPRDMSSQICLKWNSFLSNIATSFESLWEEEGLVDVTLASDGQCLTAHKVILSASSPFFKKVFQVSLFEIARRAPRTASFSRRCAVLADPWGLVFSALCDPWHATCCHSSTRRHSDVFDSCQGSWDAFASRLEMVTV